MKRSWVRVPLSPQWGDSSVGRALQYLVHIIPTLKTAISKLKRGGNQAVTSTKFHLSVGIKLATDRIILREHETVKEAEKFGIKKNGTYGGITGHDDLIMTCR